MDRLATPTALREISDLPGPRGLPVFGNIFQVDRDRLHQNVETWRRQFGPLFRFKLGPRAIVCVSDHKDVMGVLRDRPDGFQRTQHFIDVGEEMGLKPGLFSSGGDAWKRQRRMVMAGFDPTHVKAYFPSLQTVTQRLRRRWASTVLEQRSIELQPELMRYTVDAIAGLAFGADVNTLESDREVIQQHLDKIFPALFKRLFSAAPWWRWFPDASDRELARSVATVHAAIADFVAQARDRLATDAQRRAAPPNLLEAMLVASTEDAAVAVTDDEIVGNVMTMLLAGEDTTANTLAWLIHLLHRHPEALARAKAEVRAAGFDATGLTHQGVMGLDFLEACAHETMRLKPVAPFQIVEALRDTVIGDVRVPVGTPIWCMARTDSVDAAYFAEPQAFRPERWLTDGGPAQEASAAKRVSMPFGAGPRVCPGRYLALLEIKMAMAMLLTHFEIDDVTTPDGAEAAEHLSFTMMPVGLRMTLRERPVVTRPGVQPRSAASA